MAKLSFKANIASLFAFLNVVVGGVVAFYSQSYIILLVFAASLALAEMVEISFEKD